jgi:asparagine synthase (glutamine-hydrolysing)
MSGFTGFTGKMKNRQELTAQMAEAIKHRNPELLHVYFNETKTITAVLDGEITNRAELRNLLTEKNHSFTTDSDSELVIHLYEEYGAGLAEKLSGPFAFVVYDLKNKKLYAARDHFGIKPFYYAVLDNHFLFGSEIKSLLQFPLYNKELNESALEQYLTFQYSVLDETFFKGIFKLPPAHFMITEKNKITEKKRYWAPKFEPLQIDSKTRPDETVAKISEAVETAVAKYTADAETRKIGTFLSSGVDSSYIAATFCGEKTFTVGFGNEEHNETSYAAKLSGLIGKHNISKIITSREYWDALPTVQYHMDEPLADPAAVALYFVSELASKHVDVALSGEGADEFFGGYNIYREPLSLRPITVLPASVRRFLGALFGRLPFNFKGKNYIIRGSKDVEERFIGNANIFSVKERELILSKQIGGNPPSAVTKPFYDEVKHLDDVTKMQYIDINLWMVGDILLKADKMSMAHSLCVRSPLLDLSIFKLASALPPRFKITKRTTKHVFRKAAESKLPPDTAQKKKLGFPVPIRVWLKEDAYYRIVRARFESSAAKKYFKTDELIKMLDRHRNGQADNSRKIWVVYMFLVWYGVFFHD